MLNLHIIKRRVEPQITEALERSPSVALLGPRQVGKTTIALNISETTPSVYLDGYSALKGATGSAQTEPSIPRKVSQLFHASRAT